MTITVMPLLLHTVGWVPGWALVSTTPVIFTAHG